MCMFISKFFSMLMMQYKNEIKKENGYVIGNYDFFYLCVSIKCENWLFVMNFIYENIDRLGWRFVVFYLVGKCGVLIFCGW